MGRKKKAAPDADARAIELAARSAEEAEAQRRDGDARFLEAGEEYNLHVALEKARVFRGQMAGGLLGLGAQLILIKNHQERGGFMTAVENLGLAYRAAAYAMAAARKFGANAHTCAHLGALGSAKMRALAVLDDEDAMRLAEGASVEGVGTLDDVAQMTVKELREALRKEREKRRKERDAQERVIAEKNDRLNELEAELRYQQPPAAEQRAGARLAEMRRDYAKHVAAAWDALARALALVDDAERVEGATRGRLEAFAGPEADATAFSR